MRTLMLVALMVMLSGCALTTAADKLEGVDLLQLVEKENAAGCIKGVLTGSHLGASGVLNVWATWGKTPPDCGKVGP